MNTGGRIGTLEGPRAGEDRRRETNTPYRQDLNAVNAEFTERRVKGRKETRGGVCVKDLLSSLKEQWGRKWE